MEIKFGMSILSKREIFLGAGISFHNGVVEIEDEIFEEQLTEVKFGFIFFIIGIRFITIGNKMKANESIHSAMLEAIKSFEKSIKKDE